MISNKEKIRYGRQLILDDIGRIGTGKVNPALNLVQSILPNTHNVQDPERN